ncbi:MAG: PaaI family thioesterase [Polyangia bacterium]
MDAASVKNLVEQLIPFVKKTGVVADELTATKVKLHLPHDPTNLNPMGILHAGASFTLAETAAAAMCVMAFGQRVMFIGKKVEIAFKRPGKGDVFATTQLTPVDTQRIMDEVGKSGKTDAPLAVDVVDATGETVAIATVTMSVRKM